MAFKRLLALLTCVFALRAGASAVGETVAGDRAADALRSAAGTQIALVSDRAVRGGEDTAVTTTLSGAQLWAMLERAAADIVVDPARERIDVAASDTGAFVQVSGLTFKLDASAPSGSRVIVTEIDGEAVDPADETPRYAAALSADLADGTALDAQLCDILPDACSDARARGRITIIGARENLIAERIPVGLLPAGCAVAALAAVLYLKKLRRHSNVVLSETGIYGGLSE